MKESLTHAKKIVRAQLQQTKTQVEEGVKKYWMRAFILGLFTFILTRKDVSIDISMNAVPLMDAFAEAENTAIPTAYEGGEDIRPMNTSLLITSSEKKSSNRTKRKKKQTDSNLANTYSNMVYTDEEIATDENAKARAAKRKKQLAYVDRFLKVAQKEMKEFGIPASITLAQGLLESNVGESKLAKKNKNHFGIKCFSKKCSKGHCSNFTDDSHKDFFRIYKSAWDSYRAHSMLLKRGKRYKKLFKLDSDDYRGWAKGLKKAGYATDRKYAEKIINLIEDLNLDQYDF